MSSDIESRSVSQTESHNSSPPSPTAPSQLLVNDNTSMEYLSTPISLPKPPKNPANTVPSKTLWMGDIEPWWDEAFIIEMWAKLKKTVEVKVIKPKQGLLVHQIAKANGQSTGKHSGYCFIEFETPEEANDALSLNGTLMVENEKPFRLNWASAATLNSEIAQTPEYSLFVGDLSPSTTEAHLLALFQTQFESVKTVRVMTNPSTGLSRCFGFVRFSNEDERKRALVEMNGKWLAGRQIRVALATPKHQQLNGFNKHMNMRHLQHPPLSMESMDMYQGGGAMQGVPIGYYSFGPQGPSNEQLYNDPNNTTVFIGGLANGVSGDTLATLFEPFGEIDNIKVPPGKGCGFVKFTERKNAESAIQNMQGFVIGGSRIRLSWGRSNNRVNVGRQHISPHHQPQQLMSGPMFDYPPQQMMAPQHAVNNGQVPLDRYSQGLPHSNHGGMVGMPPGMPHPYMYDPYFASQRSNNVANENHAEAGQPVPINGDGPDGIPLSPPRFATPMDQNGRYVYMPARGYPDIMGGIVDNYDGMVEYYELPEGSNAKN